jgi:hypothetical protein
MAFVIDQKNIGETMLGLLFLIYLIFGYKTPTFLAKGIDTVYGKAIVIIIALILFVKTNPIVGVLAFFVAYQMIQRSSEATGTYGLERYLPTEKKKYSALSEYNQFPYTLEQEMVKKMAPINRSGYSSANDFTFHPVLGDTYNAAVIRS